jgi:protein-tyrosine phosphatase
MIHTILVICIGNICRSPMAEGLLKRALPEKNVRSAGINALIGNPADPFAVQIMQERGIDISEHRAQSLAGWMIAEADLILTMDQEQKRYVELKYSVSKGKVFRLGEFSSYDIPDPYQQSLDVFRQSFELITQGVNDLTERIILIH